MEWEGYMLYGVYPAVVTEPLVSEKTEILHEISGSFIKGELWQQTVFRMLADRFGWDKIRFWRTTDGKEIDFVLPDVNPPMAIEAKYDERMAKIKKYRLFLDTYPGFKFQFATPLPWSEDFFRRFM